MKRRREHNIYCESFGLDPKVCNDTDQWMDAPAKKGGGCTHREKRHSSTDCLKWALKADTGLEGVERFLSCEVHREGDRKTDRCGSEALYSSNQNIIPLLNAGRHPILRMSQELFRLRRERRKGHSS